MARKSSPTIVQEELYPSEEQDFPRAAPSDTRLLDLDADQESPFLRAQKRVSVRRGSLPKTTAVRLKWLALGATTIAAAIFVASTLYEYGEHSWRFRIDSSDDIEISGIHNATRSQIMEVLGGDIGRNIFFIPLSQRKAQLERIPWVQSASVMRFVPNHLKVEIQERTPVAFARIGAHIALVDADGELMDLPAAARKKYSFPVIEGMNSGEPLSTRTARMKIYNQLMHDLDAEGGNYSRDISEVDLSDPDDVKVITADSAGDVLIHLGSADYLSRYKVYVSHAREWRQQFEKLDSVDLRYDRQIIVNPDSRGSIKDPLSNISVPKTAMAMGVKPAALRANNSKAAAATAQNPRLIGERTTSRAARRVSLKSAKRHARPGKAKPWSGVKVEQRPGGEGGTGMTAVAPAVPNAGTAGAVPTANNSKSTNIPKPSPAITKAKDQNQP